MRRWVVCQIGAREHYAVARGLHGRGLLEELITDVWMPHGAFLRRIPWERAARMAGRFDDALASANVTGLIGPSAWMRQLAAGRDRGWPSILHHNAWFNDVARRRLQAVLSLCDEPMVVFAYSYAARRILEVAKAAGHIAVLGQIDGGPEESELVAGISRRHGLGEVELPPNAYWTAWRAECALADRIVVNSGWSRELLIRAGVDESKIVAVPLMYDAGRASGRSRQYPTAFTAARPLRVLFLGSLTVRKGIAELLQAAAMLQGRPIELSVVGADVHGVAAHAGPMPNVRLLGAVPRNVVDRHYRDADVFIFPTHSDGFGLTQLEAQAAGLPAIATPFCADVVKDGENGLILPEVSPQVIAAALEGLLHDPAKLAAMSVKALDRSRHFTSEAVVPMLVSLAEDAPAKAPAGTLQ